MITSIIKLPEFSPGNVSIYGESPGGIYSSQYIDDVQFPQKRGRVIPIGTNIFKYKIRVTEPYGKVVDVIILSFSPITGNSDPYTEIFPVYLRETTTNGFNTHFLSSVIFNVESINRFFSAIGTPHVTTIADVLSYGVSRYTSDISHIPYEILDNKCDKRYATLATIPDDLMERFCGGCEGDREYLQREVSSSCVTEGIITGEIKRVFNANCWFEIAPFVDHKHTLSFIELMIRSVESQFSFYHSLINSKHPPYDPVYKNCNKGCMDSLLYLTSMLPDIDFTMKFTVDRGTPVSMDRINMQTCVFNENGSTCSTPARLNWNICKQFQQYLCGECNVIPSDGQLIVTGSYLEDLWVYDSSDELVTYIDLVWWNLAAGAGLINISSAYIQ